MAEDKKPLPIAQIVTGAIIVMILIVYALPRLMNWTEGTVIGNEVSKLYYNLESAKSTAGKNKHKVWVVFQGTSGYKIFEDINNNGVHDGGEPARTIKLDPSVQFGINLEPPIQNVWGTGTVSQPIEFLGGGKEIHFMPNGKASKTGAVYFIAKADLGHSDVEIQAVKIVGAVGEISVLRISPNDSPPWK